MFVDSQQHESVFNKCKAIACLGDSIYETIVTDCSSNISGVVCSKGKMSPIILEIDKILIQGEEDMCLCKIVHYEACRQFLSYSLAVDGGDLSYNTSFCYFLQLVVISYVFVYLIIKVIFFFVIYTSLLNFGH